MCLKIPGETQAGSIFGKSGHCNEGRVCASFCNISSSVKLHGPRVSGYSKFLRQALTPSLLLASSSPPPHPPPTSPAPQNQLPGASLAHGARRTVGAPAPSRPHRAGKLTAGVDLRVPLLFGFREHGFENVTSLNPHEHNCCLNKVVLPKVRNTGP